MKFWKGPNISGTLDVSSHVHFPGLASQNEDHVVCIDTATGKLHYKTLKTGNGGPHNGGHTGGHVPISHGGTGLVAVGNEGDILTTRDGTIKWISGNTTRDWTVDQGTGEIHTSNYVNTNTQLSTEEVADVVGGMLEGAQNEIVVAYDDETGNLTFAVSLDEDTKKEQKASEAEALAGTDDIKAITAKKVKAAFEARKVHELSAPTSAFDMASQKITNLATPTSENDAARKKYVDDEILAIPDATSSARGLVKFGSNDYSAVTPAVPTSVNAKQYLVQRASASDATMSVNVPWVDTTYTVRDGQLSEYNLTNAKNNILSSSVPMLIGSGIGYVPDPVGGRYYNGNTTYGWNHHSWAGVYSTENSSGETWIDNVPAAEDTFVMPEDRHNCGHMIPVKMAGFTWKVMIRVSTAEENQVIRAFVAKTNRTNTSASGNSTFTILVAAETTVTTAVWKDLDLTYDGTILDSEILVLGFGSKLATESNAIKMSHQLYGQKYS